MGPLRCWEEGQLPLQQDCSTEVQQQQQQQQQQIPQWLQQDAAKVAALQPLLEAWPEAEASF